MKLLGWIHRKFRQDSGGCAGPACMLCVSGWESPDDGRPNFRPSHLRRELPPAEIEPPASAAAIHFDGLLNIGTFGLPVLMESAVEELADVETEESMDEEFISISDELEKVFTDVTEEERGSVRPSQAGAAGKGPKNLPLQHFLLGSPVQVAETVAGEDRRRERRASLGELFMKSRATEEGGGGEKKDDPLSEGEGTKMMRMGGKKDVGSVRKKRMHNILESIGNGGGGGGATNICRGKEIKVQNILKMFHRKIHPENSIAWKKLKKPSKYESSRVKYGATGRDESNNYGEVYDMKNLPPNQADQSISTVKNRYPFTEPDDLLRSHSTSNREHWIKTDADYLVLEL